MDQPSPAAGVHTFLPLPPRSLSVPPPPYHLPTLVTTYSHLPDRSIAHDDSSMAYHRPAPLGCDLNYGFERRIERVEDEEEHLDGLCDALRELEERGGKGERKGGIITWRGMITRIMTAPFEDREGWEMTAIPLAGSVYIELHDPPEVRSKRRKDQSSWAWQTYMGYAYEAFSAYPPADAEVDEEGIKYPLGWSGDVNTNVQWCNVVRSAIGDIPLCLGGEVDCVDAFPGSPHPGLEKCVELKTNRVIENPKQEMIFHKKLLKHWTQSWLLGVPKVEVGFRDDHGILKTRQVFETQKIPRFIASLPQPLWGPSPCLHFLHALLDLVLTHVLPRDPTPTHGLRLDEPLPKANVWRISFIPRRGCELYRVENVNESNGRWGGVLKEDYVRWRMSR